MNERNKNPEITMEREWTEKVIKSIIGKKKKAETSEKVGE